MIQLENKTLISVDTLETLSKDSDFLVRIGGFGETVSKLDNKSLENFVSKAKTLQSMSQKDYKLCILIDYDILTTKWSLNLYIKEVFIQDVHKLAKKLNEMSYLSIKDNFKLIYIGD